MRNKNNILQYFSEAYYNLIVTRTTEPLKAPILGNEQFLVAPVQTLKANESICDFDMFIESQPIR